VTKPGGSLGITEATWIETPSGELVAQLSDTCGPVFAILDMEGWSKVMRGAALQEVSASSNRMTPQREHG
jgi:hypothetical protein